MCGAFIACLELTRQHQIKVFQTQTGGEIRIERVSEEELARIRKDEEEERTALEEEENTPQDSAESELTEEKNGASS